MKNIFYLSLLCLSIIAIGCNKTAVDKMATGGIDMPDNVTINKNAWRAMAPKAAAARSISIGDYTSFELANGLKVIVVENHKLPKVSYQLTLNNDPIQEKDQAGYVSIAGQMLKTGTKSKSKAQLDEEIDFIGASISTFGNGAFGTSLKKHQDKLLSLMTEILYEPSFPKEEFDKIKTQTLSGLSTTKTDPNAMAANVASVLNYGKDHPYGEIENETTVTSITLDKCKEYYNTYFKANNAYLVVVGDVVPAEAKATVEKYFGAWKKGQIPTQQYKTPAKPEGTKVAVVNKDAAVQSVIRVTYPVQMKTGDADITAAKVMNSILGGGIFSGRLMQNLREDKAYTYGARSSISQDKLVGNFNASASVRNEVTDSSVQEFLLELNRMRSEKVSADDLKLSKNSMAGSFARSLESPQTIARFALNTARYNLPADYYNTYLERLDAVTVEDIQAAAQKYITPENAYIVVAGSKDEIADKLKRFDTDGEIDFYDAFGTKVEQNTAALPEGITGETVVASYIKAIGGADKLKAVKSVEQSMSMAIMGQEATMIMKQKDSNKFAMAVKLGEMVMQEQVYDGTKMKSAGMGQSNIITEGPELEKMAEQARMFPRMSYTANGYKLDLKGVEYVDGAKCYKVNVTSPSGNKSTEFYNQTSGLLVRSISTEEMQGQSITQTSDYADYKAVDGVMFPHKMTVSGAMPTPLVMNVSSIVLNGTMADTLFEVK